MVPCKSCFYHNLKIIRQQSMQHLYWCLNFQLSAAEKLEFNLLLFLASFCRLLFFSLPLCLLLLLGFQQTCSKRVEFDADANMLPERTRENLPALGKLLLAFIPVGFSLVLWIIIWKYWNIRPEMRKGAGEPVLNESVKGGLVGLGAQLKMLAKRQKV